MEPEDQTATTKQPAGRRRSGKEVISRLRDAASEEFGVHGYSRAKTAAIAQRAGVSENLLFKHFGSKANLFNDTIFLPIEEHFARFSESHAIGSDTANNREAVSKQYIREMQDFIRQHAEPIMLLIMSSSFESGEVNGIDKLSGLQRYFETTSSIVRERLPGEPKFDPRLAACIAFGSIVACEAFRDWLFPDGWGSETAIREAVAEFVLGGSNALTGS